MAKYYLLIKDITQLVTCNAKDEIIKEGTVAIKDGKIIGVGKTFDFSNKDAAEVITAIGKTVTPGLVDCHTHLVHAGSREHEFKWKLEGKSYLEIARLGGGILSTVEKTRNASKDELKSIAKSYLDRMLRHGTTTIEAKSGYGLNLETEQKILEVINWLNKEHDIDIVPTFLAHTIPTEFNGKTDEYLDYVIEMLPKLKHLAKYCDIFCEKDNFTAEHVEKLFKAAKQHGYGLRLHAGQFNDIQGIAKAAELGAVSAEHIDVLDPESIEAMKKHGTMGVLLPIVPYYLMTDKYADARLLLDKGIRLAVSTDFNPGSSPCYSLQFAMNMACLKMKLTPYEALKGATYNAACALELQNEIGSLEVGKKADIIVWDAPNIEHAILYYFGDNRIETVIKKGRIISSS